MSLVTSKTVFVFDIASANQSCGDNVTCYVKNCLCCGSNSYCWCNNWNCHQYNSGLLRLCWQNVLLRQQYVIFSVFLYSNNQNMNKQGVLESGLLFIFNRKLVLDYWYWFWIGKYLCFVVQGFILIRKSAHFSGEETDVFFNLTLISQTYVLVDSELKKTTKVTRCLKS